MKNSHLCPCCAIQGRRFRRPGSTHNLRSPGNSKAHVSASPSSSRPPPLFSGAEEEIPCALWNAQRTCGDPHTKHSSSTALLSKRYRLHPRCSMKFPKGYNNSNSLASSSGADIWYHGGTNFDRNSGGSFIATG
uniref:Uncharacterized protein n=1 Tax=Zea mays TaxID=4577 RepID=A0A804LKS3_MAIZE